MVSRKTVVSFQGSQPSLTSWLDREGQRIYCREMSAAGDTQSARAQAPAPGHRGDSHNTEDKDSQPGPRSLYPGEISPGPFNCYSGEMHELV
jgi:hypothetical protein